MPISAIAIWRRALGACLLTAASLAQAQETVTAAADANVPAVARIEIKGQTDAYDPRRDDTAAKVIVRNDELVKYGDISVAEALKRVSGVTVTSTGHGSDVRMRGLGAGYTQILVNGERAPFGFSIDSLAPEQVERIEVIRSASAEFSTESIAGTINIVLKKTSRKNQRQIQLGYGGDTTERTPRALLLVSDRDGGFSYSLSGNVRRTTFARAALIDHTGTDISGRDNLVQTTDSAETGRFDIVSIVPRLTWALSNGDTLSTESVFTWTRFDFAAHQLTASPLGVAASYPVLDLGVFTRSAFLKSDLDWTTRLDAATRLEAKVGVQGSNGVNDSARSAPAGAAVPLQNTVDVLSRDAGWNSSGKLYRKLGEAHQLTAGWEGSSTHRDETNEEWNGGSAPALTRSAFSGRLIRAAVFVQDEWTASAGWSVYLGLRGERLNTRIDASAGVPASALSGTSAQVWSPIAQALIKLPQMPDDQVRLALTRTFKAPDLGSLIPRTSRNETNAATNPDRQGNPDLRPETASGLDLTYEHYFNKSAFISIGVSDRNIDDYTLSLVTQGADGRWVARPVNDGRATTRGVELEAKLPLALPDATLPAIELHASLSRNWSSVGSVAGPGNHIAEQIPLSALLALDHNAGALTVGGSFQFRRGAWTRVSTEQSTQTWARRDLDLYAVWKGSAARQLRLTLANLLAQDTATASAYSAADGDSRRTVTAFGHASIRAVLEQKF